QVDGPLDEARLRAALASVVEATPALRTGFARAEDGTWLQVVLRRAAQVDVAVHDVRALPAEARRARARAIVDEAHRAPFDLARPPLVRAVVVREDDARATLAFVWFHAGFDLWSVGLVERDVLAAYDGRAPGAGPTPFREAVRRALAATTPDADAAFFRGALAGLDEATLTRFWRGPDGFRLPSGERDVIARPLEAPLLGAVAAFGRARALTSSTLLHGAWALAAAHYLRVDDVLFGSVVSGRWGDVPGIEGVVGPTMEVVPVRARVRPGDALVPWLAELQARLAELQRFAHTPWERVAAYFDPPRRNVPAWSALVVENLPAELWERPSATLRLHDLEHTTHMVPPVVVSVFPFPTHHVKATFDPAFFTRDDAGRLLDAFERALAAIAAGAADVAGARAALDASFSRWGP
ncbi:MAG TPA: condensation domain-containing protein, partial [Minicystis sp.]|nr:condensation domain-containing protein [Minicystis sp.]